MGSLNTVPCPGRAETQRPMGGGPRGGERGAGLLQGCPRHPPSPAARARSQVPRPWGGGPRRCGRCRDCCCCCRCHCHERSVRRTALSPAAARPTAPCAALARGPASPDCEYAVPRIQDPSSFAVTLPLDFLAPLFWKLGESHFALSTPPLKVMRSQNLGVVFTIPCHTLDLGPTWWCTLQLIAPQVGPSSVLLPGVQLPRSHRGKPCTLSLLEGVQLSLPREVLRGL